MEHTQGSTPVAAAQPGVTLTLSRAELERLLIDIEIGADRNGSYTNAQLALRGKARAGLRQLGVG